MLDVFGMAMFLDAVERVVGDARVIRGGFQQRGFDIRDGLLATGLPIHLKRVDPPVIGRGVVEDREDRRVGDEPAGLSRAGCP